LMSVHGCAVATSSLRRAAILILKRNTSHIAPRSRFSWERRRLACSGSGQDGRAPRKLGNGHEPRLRLFASQIAKIRIAAASASTIARRPAH
jgi:hypothetical protein